MTTTTIMSAVSCGTSTNVGDFFNATKTTLQTTTTLTFSSFQVTSAAANVKGRPEVVLCEAVSPNSYATAAAGALALSMDATRTVISLSNSTVRVFEKTGDSILACGGGTAYHYAWLECPTVVTALAVTVKLQELP